MDFALSDNQRALQASVREFARRELARDAFPKPDAPIPFKRRLLTLAEHLPSEAAEALLELATGGKPRVPQPVGKDSSPFEHPDAQRRFRIMTNVEELERALDYPWEKWTIFLHPEQRQWVEHDHAGPARVAGSAGTGKTIVAVHRAAHLARTYPNARVLLRRRASPAARVERTARPARPTT